MLMRALQGTLSPTTQVCMACYRYSLTVAAILKDKRTSNDEEFQRLVADLQNSVPVLPFSLTQESELIETALKMAIADVTQELGGNQALTLCCAYNKLCGYITPTEQAKLAVLVVVVVVVFLPEKMACDRASNSLPCR